MAIPPDPLPQRPTGGGDIPPLSVASDTDKTNPEYYRRLGQYSALHVVRKWKLGYCLGQSIKYIQRAGTKDNESEIVDLKKAIWYILSHIHELDPVNQPDPADEANRGKAWYSP